jgi:hypothetical protein
MAAILTIRIVGPHASSQAASVFPTPRIKALRSIDLSAVIKRALIVGGEMLLLLWVLVVLAFCLVVVVGFVG